MAKKFAGFKPETLTKKILPALGYSGPSDEKSINLFLASNPAAAAKMGKYTMAARQMVEGKPIQANRGTNAIKDFNKLDQRQKTAERHQQAIRDFSKSIGRQDDNRAPAVDKQVARTNMQANQNTTTNQSNTTTNQANTTTNANNGVTVAEDQNSVATTDSTGKVIPANQLSTNILADPLGAVSRPKVVGADTTTGQLLDEADPKFSVDAATEITADQAKKAADVVAPTTMDTQTYTAQTSQQAVEDAGDKFQGAQGQVSDEALREAVTMDPTKSAVLDLKTEEGVAAQVDAPDALRVGEGELIDGTSVDQERIQEELEKAEAVTVSGELGRLMDDFSARGDTPAWAAGAMRAANAAMAARGLSASSMAGMAVVQASMEAALPIAKLDAANKQEMAVLKAKQRANFLNVEFDQEFETKVRNAARISEIANKNFDADVTIALENAKLTNSMEVANLSARSAKTVADTAALASLERQNLSEVNKAAADNAQAFLDMDFANLDNEQEAARVRFQETANAIINDTAQVNAAEQFNATEMNDAEEFIKMLANDVAKFNAEQHNAMERFNAGEKNAMKEFNAENKLAREKFNADAYRIIKQANATFKQQVTTDETAALNAAYETEAKAANQLSETAYNNLIMEAKDMMYYAFTSSEGALDRINKIATANINAGNGDSGDALEQGLIDITKEFISEYIKSRFKIG